MVIEAASGARSSMSIATLLLETIWVIDFLPSEAGEVAPSYGDGGVKSP